MKVDVKPHGRNPKHVCVIGVVRYTVENNVIEGLADQIIAKLEKNAYMKENSALLQLSEIESALAESRVRRMNSF